jgi:mono/diheme cytochrome c family protein
MTRNLWIGMSAGLTLSLALTACTGRGGRERTQGEAGQPSQQPRGMMDGGMGGMMGTPADTAAAPQARAVAASAAGCPQTSQELVDAGRRIFTGSGNCYACHSSNAKGTPTAPDLTDSIWINIVGSYGAIAGLVRQGVPQPKQFPVPMPAEGGAHLDSLQVCAVAAYVYSLGH